MQPKYILAVSLTVIVLVAGCISTTTNSGRINDLFTRWMTVPSNEIPQINYSDAETKARSLGYECKNTSSLYILDYMFLRMENNTQNHALLVYLYYNNSNPSESYIAGRYRPEYPFPESNLIEKEQWLKDRVDEIAQICNLTVNWSQVQWSISYAD